MKKYSLKKNYLKKLDYLLNYIYKHELLLSIIVVIVMVTITIGLGIQRNHIVPINSWTPSHYYGEPNNRLSFLANWDGGGYISIAKHGYSSGLTNLFPLYPLLIHIINKILSSPLISGLLISWFSLIGAIYFYIKIIKNYFNIQDNLEALRGVLIFLLYPSAIFLIANYTESLFAFLSLGAIYFALKHKYLYSGLFCLFATATHINGLFTLLLVLLILFEEKEKLINIAKTFLIGIMGIIGYMIFLKVKFKNALEFLSQQKAHHGWLQHTIIPVLAHINPIEYLFILLIIISIIYWWPRRKSFAIYSFLFLLIPIAGGTFGGFTRYTLMIFPLQLMIFKLTQKKVLVFGLCLALITIGWTYFALQFIGGFTG